VTAPAPAAKPVLAVESQEITAPRYHPESLRRYHGESRIGEVNPPPVDGPVAGQVPPGNLNVSIRIFSPGDSGSVTQENHVHAGEVAAAVDQAIADALGSLGGAGAPAGGGLDDWRWEWTWTGACFDAADPTAGTASAGWDWIWNWSCEEGGATPGPGPSVPRPDAEPERGPPCRPDIVPDVPGRGSPAAAIRALAGACDLGGMPPLGANPLGPDPLGLGPAGGAAASLTLPPGPADRRPPARAGSPRGAEGRAGQRPAEDARWALGARPASTTSARAVPAGTERAARRSRPHARAGRRDQGFPPAGTTDPVVAAAGTLATALGAVVLGGWLAVLVAATVLVIPTLRRARRSGPPARHPRPRASRLERPG
jgi:hypothetical protein